MGNDLVSILNKNRVIPVAQFDDLQSALKTAELLQKHSINILEITLRTESALESIRGVIKDFPGLLVGAGSILSMDALKGALDAGAAFCVAPGMDLELVDYAASRGTPFIPGVATPTELNTALKKCAVIKLFPASTLGGPEYIKAVAAPFRSKDFHLVPTGGVNQDNFLEYLKQDRVISVGMSYIVDSALIKRGDYAALGERMKKVMSALP
ncbi:MAG TPA: bifunctional 4-hydroxy-2-oxoglutarate aldolase/2-dehydro-3-deoxy-phosphogluconate aldolase [Spirochaetota bacterium]|nr:bifunctional 4-hydroxy-2-oxoglutarate aldolase/2-dehydro-3-deoxy-phosphogluconate aldolase [Spirochaetota bacterium]HPV40865.1 bifunctional 4-hydroxy-2-oxoglutarate aldolase/2-dehydro-3-deoxy-phosphogluconate aldolase [Spirochaetota bacterium]